MSEITKSEIKDLLEHLRLANSALKIANANVEESKQLSRWANQKLMEKEDEIRRMRLALIAAYEPPYNSEVEAICKKLESPYGMITPATADAAATMIRKLWRCASGRLEG